MSLRVEISRPPQKPSDPGVVAAKDLVESLLKQGLPDAQVPEALESLLEGEYGSDKVSDVSQPEREIWIWNEDLQQWVQVKRARHGYLVEDGYSDPLSVGADLEEKV